MSKLNKFIYHVAKVLITILIGYTISSCASLSGTAPSFGNNKTATLIQQSDTYVSELPKVSLSQIASNVTNDVFKSGDVADITFYNVEALTNSYVVDRAGNINFPLIGTVKVAGQGTTQLQKTLTQRYGENYLRAPSINVKLEAQDLGRVIVDGAVNSPGVYEIKDIITLSEAVALAAGIDNEITQGARIYIVREIEGKRKVQEVDIREIRQFGVADPQIIPNDLIFVQDSAGRVAFREFLRTVPLLNAVAIYATRR